MMSEKQSLPSGTLHFFGEASLIFWLKQGVIPLSSGLALAHPFVNPGAAIEATREPVSADILDAEWQRQYEALPLAVKSLLSFEHFRAQQGELASTVVAAARKRQFGKTPQYDRDRLARARVARLFPSALSYLAWREHADRFSGLAVALASRHEALSRQEGRPALLAPVLYGGEHRYQITASNPFPGLLSDHPACSDNQEWRLLLPDSSVPVKTGPDRQQHSVLPIQRGLITAVYWSVETPEATIEAVRQLVGRDMRYRSVALGMVVPDQARWQLRMMPLER